MKIGERIEQIAKQKAVKPAVLAEKMEMTQTHIYRLFKADDMKLDVLRRLADILEVSITAFFDESSSHERVSIEVGTGQSGGASAVGKKVVQKNLSLNPLDGPSAAKAAQLLEQLTKCESERKGWERERASYQETIRTQRELIDVLKPAARP